MTTLMFRKIHHTQIYDYHYLSLNLYSSSTRATSPFISLYPSLSLLHSFTQSLSLSLPHFSLSLPLPSSLSHSSLILFVIFHHPFLSFSLSLSLFLSLSLSLPLSLSLSHSLCLSLILYVISPHHSLSLYSFSPDSIFTISRSASSALCLSQDCSLVLFDTTKA